MDQLTRDAVRVLLERLLPFLDSEVDDVALNSAGLETWTTHHLKSSCGHRHHFALPESALVGYWWSPANVSERPDDYHEGLPFFATLPVQIFGVDSPSTAIRLLLWPNAPEHLAERLLAEHRSSGWTDAGNAPLALPDGLQAGSSFRVTRDGIMRFVCDYVFAHKSGVLLYEVGDSQEPIPNYPAGASQTDTELHVEPLAPGDFRVGMEDALTALIGTHLIASSRDLNELQLAFAELPAPPGRPEARWLLKVYCAWRLTAGDELVVGSANLFTPSKPSADPLTFSYEEPDSTLWDMRWHELLSSASPGELKVSRTEALELGSCRLLFVGGLALDVFANAGGSEDFHVEHWILVDLVHDRTFAVASTGVEWRYPAEESRER